MNMKVARKLQKIEMLMYIFEILPLASIIREKTADTTYIELTFAKRWEGFLKET